ncbi:hypothetical protein CDD82_3786 [Ophiocordyceps australis]|uniref:Uncharacterized protein n=1 Tax=Ophiocordyceps australis TaxID=1399860 RepID=A0A2C5ZBP0_9HYPO|nr:hypothetical protein CDD82_3786 [Ophiocordyceps australis]
MAAATPEHLSAYYYIKPSLFISATPPPPRHWTACRRMGAGFLTSQYVCRAASVSEGHRSLVTTLANLAHDRISDPDTWLGAV